MGLPCVLGPSKPPPPPELAEHRREEAADKHQLPFTCPSPAGEQAARAEALVDHRSPPGSHLHPRGPTSRMPSTFQRSAEQADGRGALAPALAGIGVHEAPRTHW